MIDGFHAMMNLNWINNSLKYVFHIADQPPHGKKYSNGVSDSYPNGCPCGKTIEPLIQKLNELEIAYKLCKIGSNLNLYASIMKNEIQNYEEITLESSVNMDVKVSESLFKDLLIRQYDVRNN